MLEFLFSAGLYEHMPEEYNTASDLAYEAILRDLVEKAWPVDARLKPNELAEKYQMASSAVREALIRLAAMGFVINYPQRGFRTIQGTARSVSETAQLRGIVEIEAASLSIENGDLEWEANLAASHHRLTHLETRLGRMENPSLEELRIWTEAELSFHGALIAACDSGVLIQAQRDAFVLFRLHLVSVYPGWGFRGAESVREHEKILSAALARDKEGCAAAIRKHFEHFPKELAARELKAVAQA